MVVVVVVWWLVWWLWWWSGGGVVVSMARARACDGDGDGVIDGDVVIVGSFESRKKSIFRAANVDPIGICSF